VAAQEAAARASYIRRWKATLEQRRDEYEQMEPKADGAMKQKRYREAAKLWTDFRDDTKKVESECPFSKDRYRTLLYDGTVAGGLKKVGDEARAAWPLQMQEAQGLAREGGYEAAVKLLQGVVDPGDYPWSSYAHHAGLRPDPVVTDHLLYWELGNTPFQREAAYIELAGGPLAAEMLEEIKHALLKGWPLGSQAFKAELQLKAKRQVLPAKRGRPFKTPPA
jgi:hypothetical protein